MKIDQVYTPAILLNLDYMEHNLKKYADLAAAHGKQIWPMIKTHKSTELALLQQQYGCTGFLCGTLDEAEALCAAGIKNIMYAYPVATNVSIDRVIALSQKCNFIIRIDGEDAAKAIQEQAAKQDVSVQYTIIVDSGLHRFGVAPDKVVPLADALKACDHLVFKGISTHPGHVYGACSHDDLAGYCEDEARSMAAAAEALQKAGYTVDIISSGSTPTFAQNIADEHISIYHPGNYIFNDTIQLSTQTASEEE
uniref:alanine racemase n=1 Tax=uncultured Megasphaera sp. TaxID=165188 RepID=UPI0026111B98